MLSSEYLKQSIMENVGENGCLEPAFKQNNQWWLWWSPKTILYKKIKLSKKKIHKKMWIIYWN